MPPVAPIDDERFTMTSDLLGALTPVLLAALQPVLDRLEVQAANDPDFRGHLREWPGPPRSPENPRWPNPLLEECPQAAQEPAAPPAPVVQEPAPVAIPRLPESLAVVFPIPPAAPARAVPPSPLAPAGRAAPGHR